MIIDVDNLVLKLRPLRPGKKIVLATGVFDLLHLGHIKFLKNAKKTGDILIVGLESDARVRVLKGDNRPIEPIQVRLKKVAQVKQVDFAFALPSNFDRIEREQLIAQLKPDVLAISSHSLHRDQKKALVEKYGGKLEVVIEQDKRYSTTQKIADTQSKLKSAK